MEIVDLIIKWSVPVICTSFISFISKQTIFNKAMKSSQLAMVRAHITMQCRDYLSQGYADENDRYCLEQLYENYKNLGGNHGIEVLVNKCYDLPLKKEGKL